MDTKYNFLMKNIWKRSGAAIKTPQFKSKVLSGTATPIQKSRGWKKRPSYRCTGLERE
jgi:hypothetical protein